MISQNEHLNQKGYFVLTANRLLDGRVVWFTSQDYWGIMLEEAQLFPNKDEAEEKLQQIIHTKASRFLIDLHCTELTSSLQPITVREKIRAYGPSTHPEFNPRSLQDDYQ